MQFDTLWPVPPRSGANPAEAPPTELPGRRAYAVTILDAIGAAAEAEVLPIVDGERTMLPEGKPYRTPAAFVANRLQSVLEPLGYGSLPALVTGVSSRGQAAVQAWKAVAELPEVAAVSMLIDAAHYRHLMSPLRGDIAIFADGSAGIVTLGQCSGCGHFEVAEYTAEGVPSVIKSTRWRSNVAYVLRLVLPPQAPPAPATEPAEFKPKKNNKPSEAPAST